MGGFLALEAGEKAAWVFPTPVGVFPVRKLYQCTHVVFPTPVGVFPAKRRCLLLPVVQVDDLGVSSEDLGKVARPWVVREPGNIDEGGRRKILNQGHTTEDFGGWYKTLDAAEQRRIVGPVRQKLLADGKIDFGELVDRKTGGLRSLKELGYNDSGNFLGYDNILRNVQAGAYPVYNRDLAAHMESLDTKTAEKQVGDYFKAGFAKWRQSPHGNIPMMVLPEEDRREIGAKSQVVLLSDQTMKKQDAHHPELTLKDYERGQEIVNGSRGYAQKKPRHLAFISQNEDMAAIIKATKDGEENYMVSMYRLSSVKKWRDGEIKRLKNGGSG